MKQNFFFKARKLFHGGTHRKRRWGRGARPISTRDTMHLCLKSSKAQGPWSFREQKNKHTLICLLDKFAQKNGARIHSVANSGNYIHVHLRFTTRHTYRAFIRGVTSAIAMAITGASRWKKTQGEILGLPPVHARD